MKTNIALLAAASLAAIASPAAAQDVAENTFTGLWGGVIGGYSTSQAGDADIEDDNESIDGFAYGVQLGYDIDVGSVVIGAEAEYADSTSEVDFAEGSGADFALGNVSAGRDLYFGARIGAKVGPDAMIYAKGGYTNAKFNIRASDGVTELNQDFDTDGYRIGAGAEYALSQNAFVKLEYRYSNYSEGEVDFDGELSDSERFDIDLDRHQIMAGVGFRF